MVPAISSLRRNFLWTLAGNLIYAACQWGMLIALAKLGTADMVGQFALALAVTAPLFQFASLQLRAVQATDARHDFQFGEYLGLRLVSTAGALAVLVVIPWMAGYHGAAAAVIVAVGAAKAIESLSDILYGLLQQHERMERIARSMIFKGCFSLAALGLAVYASKSVIAGSLALAGAWLVVLLLYDVRCAMAMLKPGQARPQWNRSRLRRLAWLSLPMGLVLLLLSLNLNIPRYFIEKILGEGQLGIFAALAYLMQAGGMVVNALGNVMSPRLARYDAEGRVVEFRAMLAKFIGIAAAMGIACVGGAYYFGPALLALLYRPEYAQHSDVFIVLMIAAAVSYVSSAVGVAVTSLRCFAGQFPVNVISSLFGLVCSYYAVSRYGLAGGAVAVLAISVASLLGNAGLLFLRFAGAVKVPVATGQASLG